MGIRNIKFRGKRVDNCEWVEGYLCNHYSFNPFEDESEIKCKIAVQTNTENSKIYPVIPETVGQFTGLHDKSGIEIFEGDIIAVKRIKNFKTEYLFPIDIKMEDRGENGIGWTQFSPRNEWEVIGNIHENPELLK